MRRGLAPVMEAARITGVTLNRPDLRFPFPPGFVARLKGWRISHVERRAKYLLAHLTSGETLIVHLGMSGRMRVDGAAGLSRFHRDPAVLPAHDHVVFALETAQGPARVTYNDARRFGYMDLVPTGELSGCTHLSALGPEPLSEAFDHQALSAALTGRRTSIKQALLDQRVVAGLGNIYVCEALFRAGISPRRTAATIAGKRARRLVPHIRNVLAEAIEAGGSSLRDHRQTNGALGYFQHNFAVYDRADEPCLTCGATIRRFVQSGRSTFMCGSCQR